MVDSSKIKIPLEDILAYLEEHEKYKIQIQNMIQLEKEENLSRAELEKILPRPFLKIQECMTSILKKNNIQQSSQIDHDKKLLDLFSELIQKIQKDCVAIKADQEKVPIILRDMKQTLEQSLGSNMEVQINRVVENFNSMLFSFDSHIQELKDKLQTLENKFDQNIKSLKNQLQQKEEIQEHKVKDGQVDILRELVEDYNERADNATNQINDCMQLSSNVESKHQDSDEEEKKSHKISDHQDQPQVPSKWPHLPCCNLPDVSEIKNDGSMQFKKDTYRTRYGSEWTVEGEWLNGVPHGVCIVESEYVRGVTTFTHGKERGGLQWWEYKRSGMRYSREYYDKGGAKGVYREYYSDTQKCNVSSTNHQTPTPGWLKKIEFERDNTKRLKKRLTFCDDNGNIAYGWFYKKWAQINGFEWHLKDDGTFDKFSVEFVELEKKEQEEIEDQDALESGTDGSQCDLAGEEKKTFICNEKQYVLNKDIN